MLRYCSSPVEGYCTLFHLTPFAPPNDVITAEEYRVWLRVLYGRYVQLLLQRHGLAEHVDHILH